MQRYYAGNIETEVNGGTTTVKTYWPDGLGVDIDKSGTVQSYWQHRDRLGSPILLTDSQGNAVEQTAFDAWGKRRTLTGDMTPDGLDGVADNKGFTGHEMLDKLDLVHMNGRIYDPYIARFLSADPMIRIRLIVRVTTVIPMFGIIRPI